MSAAIVTDELVSLIDAYLAAKAEGRTVPFVLITWDAPMAHWASNVAAEEVGDVLGIVALDLAGKLEAERAPAGRS